MTATNKGLFLVEHRLPRVTESELALFQAAIADACARLTARGDCVSYLGSTFLPGPERLLSLFKAGSAEVVGSVSTSSQAPPTHLEAAVELPAPALDEKGG